METETSNEGQRNRASVTSFKVPQSTGRGQARTTVLGYSNRRIHLAYTRVIIFAWLLPRLFRATPYLEGYSA